MPQKKKNDTKGKRKLLTQSTMFSSSANGCDLPTGLRPVISSRSITPNEKTSDLSLSFPEDAYSGAKYLHPHHRKQV